MRPISISKAPEKPGRRGAAFGVIAVAAAVWLVPPSALGYWDAERAGIQLDLDVGPSICIPSDGASCEGAGVGGGAGFDFGFRPAPFITFGFEISIYGLFLEHFDEVYSGGIMPLVRLNLSLEPVDVFVQTASGYRSLTYRDDGGRLELSTWTNFTFKAGIVYYPTRLDDFGLGLSVAYSISPPSEVGSCSVSGCEDEQSLAKLRAIDMALVNFRLTWIFSGY